MDDRTDPAEDYAARLERLEGRRWKRWLHVQAPYRWNLRRLHPGRMLDVGCGLGRNLAHVDGNGVGIDLDPAAVETARRRGLTAFTPDEFRSSPHAEDGRFDSILLAHVVEHMHFEEAVELLGSYLRYLDPEGRVILIAPQEAGFRSDPTHVEYADDAALAELLQRHGLVVERSYSFPLPRFAGRQFRYNEFVVVGGRPTSRRGP